MMDGSVLVFFYPSTSSLFLYFFMNDKVHNEIFFMRLASTSYAHNNITYNIILLTRIMLCIMSRRLLALA